MEFCKKPFSVDTPIGMWMKIPVQLKGRHLTYRVAYR